MAGNEEENLSAQVDASVFEHVFKAQFKNLYAYAFSIVKDESAAKEIVQQTFFKLWQQKDRFRSIEMLPPYLYRSVHNAALNHLEHLKVRAGYRQHYLHAAEKAATTPERLQTKEMESKIAEAYQALPEKSRLIFHLSRYEGLKYAEIARKLQVSEKAVEKHMTKALKIFRSKLREYLSCILL
jgi:RNA polymerase sigma-70 factor (ECF subfamily)